MASTSAQRNFSAVEPLRTQVAQVKGGHFALAACHLTHLMHHGERSGYSPYDSFRMVTGTNRGEQSLVAANMVTLRKGSVGADVESPLGVVATSTRSRCVYGVLRAGERWALRWR